MKTGGMIETGNREVLERRCLANNRPRPPLNQDVQWMHSDDDGAYDAYAHTLSIVSICKGRSQSVLSVQTHSAVPSARFTPAECTMYSGCAIFQLPP